MVFEVNVNCSRTGSILVVSFCVRIEVYNHSLSSYKKAACFMFHLGVYNFVINQVLVCRGVRDKSQSRSISLILSSCDEPAFLLSNLLPGSPSHAMPCSQAVGTEYLMQHVVGFSSINQSLPIPIRVTQYHNQIAIILPITLLILSSAARRFKYSSR